MANNKAKISQKSLKRIHRSKLNTTIGLTTSIVMGVFSFIERSIFNQYFIEDYLGLYSFFYNIIYILSFIELGLGTSIAYALYAPLDKNDYPQIAAIMRFFKKAYFCMGTIMIASGLILMPFLGFFIKTSIELSEVRLYFIFFLIGNISSYYLNYKSILFNANQEAYKITLVTNITWTLLYIVEMVISITTRNFLFYSISIFCANILKNTILNIWATKEYSYLKTEKKSRLSGDSRKQITRNTKGLIMMKIGQVMVTSTDALLISSMVGTAILGKYSNYQMISSGLLSLSTLLPSSIVASLGNAGVSETKRTLSKGFNALDLSSFLIYSTLTILLLNIVNPIISTFFGADRVLSLSTVSLICVNFYLSSMRELFISFKTSLGLYWEDRKRPLAEGFTNLILSIILGHFWGLDGIILGTVLTNIFINLIVEPQVIFHNGLKRSTFWFYIQTIIRALLAVTIGLITVYLNSLVDFGKFIHGKISIGSFSIPSAGLLKICTNFLTTSLIAISILYICFRKTPEAVAIIETVKIAFKRKKTK